MQEMKILCIIVASEASQKKILSVTKELGMFLPI